MKKKVTDVLVELSAWMMSLTLFAFILFFMFGCSTKEYITVEKVRSDTVQITKWQRDSVWLHDSIHVTERGDTVRIERWNTKYIEKQLHDTLYVATHDTVPTPYPVIKEVPAVLNWWQKLRIILGNFVLMFSVGVVLYQIIKKRLWK